MLTLHNYKVADVYHAEDGSRICSFGKEIMKFPCDITTFKDNRVMVMDGFSSVHVFKVDGQRMATFDITSEVLYSRIACHPAETYFVVAGVEKGTCRLSVAIYTVTGHFERKIQLDETLNDFLWWVEGDRPALTVNHEGYILVAFHDECRNTRVILF